jgi:hypothetical protein
LRQPQEAARPEAARLARDETLAYRTSPFQGTDEILSPAFDLGKDGELGLVSVPALRIKIRKILHAIATPIFVAIPL